MKTNHTLALVGLVLLAPTVATADVAAGERVFKRCQACHEVGDGAQNKAGPQLNGIIGRPFASISEFDYSSSLQAMGEAGRVWTAEELDGFLTNPRDHVKGTSMSFAGLRKPEDRAAIVAYLGSFSG